MIKDVPSKPVWFQPFLNKGEVLDYYRPQTYRKIFKELCVQAMFGLPMEKVTGIKTAINEGKKAVNDFSDLLKEIKSETYVFLGVQMIMIRNEIERGNLKLINQLSKNSILGFFIDGKRDEHDK